MGLNNFELTILNALQPLLQGGILDTSMLFVSHITDGGLIWAALALILILIKKTRRLGVCLLAALFFSYYLSDHILKPLIRRVRPFELYPLALLPASAPQGFSFPSAHASSSFAAATVLFHSSKAAGICAFAFASLVAFSRLYLYLHYPTDILCGAAIGILTGRLTSSLQSRL
jgi:undecaprenyl-diphosphatase